MRPIQYAAPRTLADATALLHEYGIRARILAGANRAGESIFVPQDDDPSQDG